MLFTFLRMLLWVLLMAAVVLSTLVLGKLKIVQEKKGGKYLKLIPVVLVLVLFFVPFEEMLTFSSPDTAFSGTTIGTPLLSASHEESHGFFYKDRRGKYSVVFFTETDGRYKKCDEDAQEMVFSETRDGVSVELFHMKDTDEYYLLVWSPSETLSVSDVHGTDFAVKKEGNAKNPVSFTMAAIDFSEAYALTVNGEAFPLAVS